MSVLTSFLPYKKGKNCLYFANSTPFFSHQPSPHFFHFPFPLLFPSTFNRRRKPPTSFPLTTLTHYHSTENNIKSHFAAMSLFLPAVPTKYRSQAEMLSTSLAASLDIFEQVPYTAYVANDISARKDPVSTSAYSKREPKMPTRVTSPRQS